MEKRPSHPFLDFLDPPLQNVQCSYLTQLFSVLNLKALLLIILGDHGYQRAFAALDELNLASLKPFFKDNYLQVIKQEAVL